MKRRTYTIELPVLPGGVLFALPLGLIAGGVGLGAWTIQQATGATWMQMGIAGAVTAGVAGLAWLVRWWRRRRSQGRPMWQSRGTSTMQSFDAFTNQATARLGRLVIEHGIHCQADHVRGPFTLTFRLSLTRDLAGGLRTLRNLQAAMTQALRSNVRIQESPQGILVEVQLSESHCWTPNATKLVKVTRWPRLPLGVDQFARPVLINPEEHGVMAWIAPPRRGKTASIRSTLYLMKRADPTLRFFICAMPAKIEADWGAFGLADGCLGLVGDFGEMDKALAWAVRMMQNRALADRLAIVVDDLANLTAHVPAIGSYIDELATAGAGLGVHLMLGTHTSGSKASMAGMRTMASATCRVLFKAADTSQASRSAGQRNADTGLNELSGLKGDGLLIENGTPTRIATAYIGDADVLQLPVSRGPHARPWLSPHASPSPPSPPASPAGDRAVTSGRGAASPLSPPSPPAQTPHASGPATATREGSHVTGDAVIAVTGDGDAWGDIPAGTFPVDRGRSLTDAEAFWIQYAHNAEPATYNPTRLTVLVFGSKSKARLALIKEALARKVQIELADDEPADDDEMTEALALSILEANDHEHPRRTEAMLFLSEQVRINGKDWNERGPRKAYT